ncbi:hypothetical protein VRU48_01885 [Pedobacter sp. KR3-3]|uniref:Outer membrane protein assembly factor BamE n=1 Tax=Pedobacter albus TaxID=3113905 RepID=A0ABU7I325_9SPHI|nr:hypothetical protein [Pedobacter sp. KR3-3]MEE1943838.1 hypothetical protein [Pedobacter sp. KR3-3]
MVIGLLTLASTPIIYLALAMLFLFGITSYPNRDFDKEKWKNEPDTRYELTKDLISSQILIGKTKTQVKQLLGHENGNEDDEDLWYYDIGFISSTGNVDPDILELQFKNGRVILARQIPT